MDRIWTGRGEQSDLERRSPAEVFALPSRGEALVVLRRAVEAQAGPVFVTGEAGVGKTWLWRRLRSEMPAPWRWLAIDVPPALDPAAFYGLIGHGLGLPAADFRDRTRLALADFLREATTDGVRWALVLDEAHNAPAPLLEEVRILANRLGSPDGPAALVVVGQTALACQLALRTQRALAARVRAHVHLRCLDTEEARALVHCLTPALDWDDRTLERQHRDAAGNPRRLLRAAEDAAAGSPACRSVAGPGPGSGLREPYRMESAPARPFDLERPRPVPQASEASRAEERWEAPVIGPSKPPLMVGDGMIEVGWEPAFDSELEASGGDVRSTLPLDNEPAGESWADSGLATDLDPAAETVETVNDHYTALQAWNEWARNQGRETAVPGPAAVPGQSSGQAEEGPAVNPPGQPNIWREGQQGFAPYGQLFSRLRQGRDVDVDVDVDISESS